MSDVEISCVYAAQLQPAPITPEWVVSGRPVARCAELSRASDGQALSAVWDCTAGEFDWHFDSDETVLILEGEVVIETEEGPRALRPGDVALFRAGTTCRWRVPAYVKKLAFCHELMPKAALRAVRAVRSAKRILGGRQRPAPGRLGGAQPAAA